MNKRPRRFSFLRSMRIRLFACFFLMGIIPSFIMCNVIIRRYAEEMADAGKQALFMRHVFTAELILFLFVFLISLILSDLLYRPVARLSGAVRERSGGHSDQTIEAPAYTETKEIAEAFNDLADRLDQTDSSMLEFVSNVSHELKTPMASMKVLADSLLLQEDVPPEMYREFLQDIDNEIDRENNLISEFMGITRLEQKASPMNIKQVDINALTEIILRRIRPLAHKRDIELTLLSKREVTAAVDEVKMTMIIGNLVDNAVKYNRDHGRVDVVVDSDHKNFTISVKDTGSGIPSDALPHIYERFYRVDKSRSREVGGTGLGLAIVKSAVALHRGSIRVESTENEGSTFTVTIPLNYSQKPNR